MRPLTISGAACVLGLQQEIQRSEESRYDHRLHDVLLVAQGMTCPEVARLLGDAPRSVENWVHRFDQEGLAGLTEGERSGRPSRLDEKQVKEINRVLRAKPSDAGMRVNLWDGKTLSAWIDRTYGVQLACASASACSDSSNSASVNLVRYWQRQIQRGRGSIKKTPKPDGARHRGPVGAGRSPLSTVRIRCRMWVPPETKDPIVYHHPTRIERRVPPCV
jgi:transposase